MGRFSPPTELVMAAYEALQGYPDGWGSRLAAAAQGFDEWVQRELTPADRAEAELLQKIRPPIGDMLNRSGRADLPLLRERLSAALSDYVAAAKALRPAQTAGRESFAPQTDAQHRVAGGNVSRETRMPPKEGAPIVTRDPSDGSTREVG